MERHTSDPLPPATGQQLAILQDSRRFIVVVAGRRWRKTTLGVLKLLRNAQAQPGNYLYIAPSRRMTLLGWERLLDIIATPHEVDSASLRIRLRNGSEIRFLSEDDVTGGAIKGYPIHGVVFDEFFFFCRQKAGLAAALLPSVHCASGWILAIGTPPPRPAVKRLALVSRIAMKRAGFDQGSVAVYLHGSGISASRLAQLRAAISEITYQSELLPHYS